MKRFIALSLMFLLLTGCSNQKTNNEADGTAEFTVPPPPPLTTNFIEIQKIKNAIDTLPKEDIEEFVSNNTEYLWLPSSYKSIEETVAEIYSTTFAFLDGKLTDEPYISFYHERNIIDMLYELNETKRIRFISYTPKNEANSERDMSKNKNLVFEKEILIDGKAVKIFSFNNGTEGFRAQTRIDETIISIWTFINQPLEEFEKDLERFTFAKISDMVSPATNTDAVPIS